MLRISLEEDVCTLTPRTVRRIVRLAKESPRITAGELQRLVESWGQKVSKATIRRHLHHHMLFGRVARKKASAVNQQQTKAQFAKCLSLLATKWMGLAGGFGFQER